MLARVLWAVPVKVLGAVPVLLWRCRPCLGASEEWFMTLTVDIFSGPTHQGWTYTLTPLSVFLLLLYPLLFLQLFVFAPWV